MMRTRNFRVRNEVVERGSVTKSQQGKKAHFERKVGECFEWKAHRQCSTGDSCSFSHKDEKDDRLLPHRNSKAKTDEGEENPQKHQATKSDRSSDKRIEIPCRYRICKNPSCKYFHFVCQNYKSEEWYTHGKECFFCWLVEPEEKPSKKSKKGGVKGSVALFKESTPPGCASQDSYPRTSIPLEEGKLGPKHAVKISRGTWHQNKNSGKKGSIARNFPKVCTSRA